MAEEEDQNQNDAAEEGENGGGGSSKKRILVVGIVLFVIILGAGAGGFFFLAGGDANPSAEVPEGEAGEEHEASAAEEGEKKPESEKEGEAKEGEVKEGEGAKGEGAKGKTGKKEEDEENESILKFGFGKTFTFKPFTVNLGNPMENQYANMEVSVEYRTPAAEEELNLRKAQLRDAIISIVSKKTREFLLNPDGKEQLRMQILRQINHYMKNKVEQVFITDILIE